MVNNGPLFRVAVVVVVVMAVENVFARVTAVSSKHIVAAPPAEQHRVSSIQFSVTDVQQRTGRRHGDIATIFVVAITFVRRSDHVVVDSDD